MNNKLLAYAVLIVAVVGVYTVVSNTTFNGSNNATGLVFFNDPIDHRSQARVNTGYEHMDNGDKKFIAETTQDVVDFEFSLWKWGRIIETYSAKDLGSLYTVAQGNKKIITGEFIDVNHDFKDRRGVVYTVNAVLPNDKKSNTYRIDQEFVDMGHAIKADVRKKYGVYSHQ